jgi:hypothetical protein
VSTSRWLTLDGTRFSETEFTRLWFLAAVTYGVGDVVTTIALFGSPRLQEANVVLSTAIQAFGQVGLVGAKLTVFGLCIAVSLWSAHAGDRFGYYFPPTALAVTGAFTTAFNLRLLIG